MADFGSFWRNAANNRSSTDPLGRGGPAGLRDIIGQYFLPELKSRQGTRGGIESAFLKQSTEPGALFGAANTAAEGYAKQLFAPGGEIASLISQVRGKSISRGFDPSAAEGPERNILNQGVGQVGNFFAQQAGGLEQARFGGLAQSYFSGQQGISDLLESLYTGVAGAEQLQLAKHPPRQRFLGIF